MEWKNKIYDHEVPPPEHIWDGISHDLDNGDFVVFKQLLHEEAAPPAGVWNNISRDLDNEDFVVFREKLFHAEAAPPGDAWAKISQDLDNAQFLTFKEKLFHAEVSPPAIAWDHIEAQLSETKVVPMRGKNNVLVKVMAAAGLVGIMFFAANYLMVGDSEIETVTADQAGASPKNTEKKEQAQGDKAFKGAEISEQSSSPAYTIAANRVVRKTSHMPMPETESTYSFEYEGLDRAQPVTVENTPFTDRMDVSGSLNRKIRNQYGEIREDVSLLDLPNSYFMMTGPNGQSIRVSSKFRNTIQYLNAEGKEELLDVILRESQYWKSVFRDWKDKVGNSSFVPSVDNFMDIAELMKLIQEPQQEK